MKLFSENIEDLRTLYVTSLKKALDMEQKITKALPTMIEKSTDTQLATAFRNQFEIIYAVPDSAKDDLSAGTSFQSSGMPTIACSYSALWPHSRRSTNHASVARTMCNQGARHGLPYAGTVP